MDPITLLLLGGAALFVYAVSQGQKQAASAVPTASSALTIGQTAYLSVSTAMTVNGQSVTLQQGTRVYIQTADASGTTEIRTDSGNVGTVPTVALVATLPVGVTMQVN